MINYNIYKVVYEPLNHVLGVRFGVYFTLLGAVVRVAATAHFPLGSSLKIKLKGANGDEERGREEKTREKSKRLNSALRTEVEVEESRKRNEECMNVLSSRNVKSVADGLCQGF